MTGRIKDYILLMRPHQYVKNVFIILPLFFGRRIFESGPLLNAALAFIAFSLFASSVYIFNDYHDIEEDRRHPEKKNRPLASGKVPQKEALVLMAALAVSGLAMSFLLNINAFYLFVSYLVLNVLYTLKLKHIAIIDVFVVAACFVIRLFVGSVVTGVELSMWIILVTFLLALFLAFAKRRDDLIIYLQTKERTRAVLDGYNLETLNAALVTLSSVIIVAYIMYTVSPEIIAKAGTDKLYITVFFVILGVMRYMQITFLEQACGSPTKVLLRDRFLQLSISGWLLTFGMLLYF